MTESLDLNHPRAMTAYGILWRELSHNAFLHFMLERFGQNLLESFTKSAGLDPLLSATFRTTRINHGDVKGRPDELVEGTVGDKPFALIIEMKVKAPSGCDQLHDYVELHRKKHPGKIVFGLLLRIPGRDKIECNYPVINGANYAEIIRRALGEVDTKTRWLVDDYLETLAFLDDLDEAIVNHPEDLKHDPWWKNNWRWASERIMREVAAQLAGRPGWHIEGPWTDPNGAFIDLRPEPLAADNARIILKWRLGIGLEVHVLPKNYKSPTAETLVAKDELWAATRPELQKLWPTGKFPSKKGKARMVGRLSFDTLRAGEIVKQLEEHVPALTAAFVQNY